MTTETPLEKLSRLSQQRTARTDKLEAEVHKLLTILEDYVEPGESVTTDGAELCRCTVRSNVGMVTTWSYSIEGEACNPDRAVNSEGYVHGDFNCWYQGPTREQLLHFAARAERFVSALISKQEKEGMALEAAAETVERASSKLA